MLWIRTTRALPLGYAKDAAVLRGESRLLRLLPRQAILSSDQAPDGPRLQGSSLGRLNARRWGDYRDDDQDNHNGSSI
jgi:hypothetical protein